MASAGGRNAPYFAGGRVIIGSLRLLPEGAPLEKIKLGISACLLGEIRYDGGHKLGFVSKRFSGENVGICARLSRS